MTPIQALQITDLFELKQALDLNFVMHAYGHEVAAETNGRVHYHNPWRDDEKPSFDVWMQQIKGRPEPEQRWGDFATEENADVFDLIQKFEPHFSTPLVHDQARELLAQQIESDWVGYTVMDVSRPKFDVARAEVLLDHRRNLYDMDAWWDTVATRDGLRNVALPPDTVFGDYETGNAVVFVLRDREGEIIGARLRYPKDENGGQRKQAVSGTPNVLMRLEPPTSKPVVLTEGETDLWAAWGALKDNYEVLGVPGVGNQPEMVAGDELDGRRVLIMFDSDEAGMAGAHRWNAVLSERGCSVSICVLPEGRDVSELSEDQIRLLPERARTLPAAPERLIRRGDQFFWITNKNGDVEAVSNWSFEPRSVLVGEDNVRSYEGRLLPSDRSVVLPASALTSLAQLQAWGQQYQARWSGNNAQVQQLAMLLDHEAAFLPEGRVTSQVGLHEGTFVWPEGWLGRNAVHYVAPTANIGLGEDQIFVEEVPVSPVRVFEAMYAAQHPAVMGPILAWLAAAPLRSRFKQFPILSVSGGSGSGKTTLLEEVTSAFSGSNITTNLTSSTPHGVMGYLQASNGFPVRFDEYRPGARKDAKEALDQSLRDAYTGQVSAKGGQNRSNLNQVSLIRTDSPIIVTGEDNFTETSHTDRMVLVRLMSKEKGNLGALQDLRTRGFAHAYLSSLLVSDNYADEAPVHTIYRPKPVSGLRDRQGANVAVLQIGWGLLGGFLRSVDPMFEMPELDLSRVIAAGEEAGATDPVMEAVRYCLENQHDLAGGIAVWVDDDYLYINSSNLLAQAAKIPGLVLPTGNPKGITQLLDDVHGAESSRRVKPPTMLGPSTRMRVSAIPLDRLEWFERDAPTVQEDI